jgi:hypothetical protein
MSSARQSRATLDASRRLLGGHGVARRLQWLAPVWPRQIPAGAQTLSELHGLGAQ